LRDPVASGVECGPHGGKKSKTKLWTGAGGGLRLTIGVYTRGLRRFTTKVIRMLSRSSRLRILNKITG
jgi:hypothetical protein